MSESEAEQQPMPKAEIDQREKYRQGLEAVKPVIGALYEIIERGDVEALLALRERISEAKATLDDPENFRRQQRGHDILVYKQIAAILDGVIVLRVESSASSKEVETIITDPHFRISGNAQKQS